VISKKLPSLGPFISGDVSLADALPVDLGVISGLFHGTVSASHTYIREKYVLPPHPPLLEFK